MCAKKNVKLEILNRSRLMFNENGWKNTSLRKIASALSMSDGNLRYHFKTKEEVVLELFVQMSDKMTKTISPDIYKFSDLESKFEEVFLIMYEYQFLFIESYFIKKEYQSYQILFNQLEESRRQLFKEEINRFKDEGTFTQKFSDEQYESLFEQLFIISDSWLKYLDLDSSENHKEQVKYYANLCFNLFVPYVGNH